MKAARKRRSTNPPGRSTLQPYTWELDWARMLPIQGPLDDAFIARLTPEIIRLRSNGAGPITLVIDSGGGDLSSLKALLGLLVDPLQDGVSGTIHTVVTNHAESAAAQLLAEGCYAVAYPHAKILFHDVSYEGQGRVTARKAAADARHLLLANTRYALTLANTISKRNLYVYQTLRADGRFEAIRKARPEDMKWMDRTFLTMRGLLGTPDLDAFDLDLPAYTLSLWQELSDGVDGLIRRAVEKLLWLHRVEHVVAFLAGGGPKPASSKSTPVSLSDKLQVAFEQSRELLGDGADRTLSTAEFGSFKARGIQRVLAAILQQEAANSEWGISTHGLGDIEQDYIILSEIASEAHEQTITTLTEAMSAFVGEGGREALDAVGESERTELLNQFVRPQACLLWRFHCLVARELFDGENELTPRDAQLLGIVDQVFGGGAVASKSEMEHRRMEAQRNSQRGTTAKRRRP